MARSGKSQKFHRGDWVRIAKDLGEGMSHFPSDREAIVIGSYADQFGGEDTYTYTLYLKGRGETSWYDDDQFTLIERKRTDKLKEWKQEIESDDKLKSDIDWIFSHGKEVMKSSYGASIKTLANGLGVTDLWGPHGDGFVYYMNSLTVLKLAKPFLKTGDKAGWLKYCKKWEKITPGMGVPPK